MTDHPKLPAGPARPARQKPAKPVGKPHHMLSEAMKKRPLEPLKLARHQMHPIQKRPIKP